MFLTKSKLLACGVVAAGLLATGTAAVARRPQGDEPKSATPAAASEQGVETKSPSDPAAVHVLLRLRQETARLHVQEGRVAELTAELDRAREELKVIAASVASARGQYDQVRRRLRGGGSLPEDPGASKDPEAIPAGTAKAAPEAQDPATRARLREIVNDEASLVRLQAERERLRAEMEKQAADLKVVDDDLVTLRNRIRNRRQTLESQQANPQAAGPDVAKAGPPRADDPTAPGGTPGGESKRPARRRNYQPLIGPHYFESSTADDRATIFNVKTRTARSVRLRTPKGDHLQSIHPVGGFGLIGLQLKGPKIARIAAFEQHEERWYPLTLDTPAEGELTPHVGRRIVAYTIGRRIWAFGAEARRWAALDIPEGVPMTPNMGEESIRIEFGNQIHTFNGKTGAWQHVKDDRSILDSIPLDDEEGHP